MKFKVLRGVHQDNNGVYTKGDIIDTKTELDKKFNSRGSFRFERVDESTPKRVAVVEEEPVQEEEDNVTVELLDRSELDKMTIKDLRQLAEDEEVEISVNAKKTEIIEALVS